jgi:putative intracellular protease/amidase
MLPSYLFVPSCVTGFLFAALHYKSNKLTKDNYCLIINFQIMAKKTAVLAVNPVNGSGLFQYLEAFFENGIPYTIFAVADTVQIKTNSGIEIKADGVIADLKGHENEYEAIVFSCGDAIPKFSENVDKQYNKDMLEVLKNFYDKGKIVIGHCAAALLLDKVGVGEGKRVALHPFVKDYVTNVVATDEKSVIDGNLYTAQTENTIWTMMPELIEVLKK